MKHTLTIDISTLSDMGGIDYLNDFLQDDFDDHPERPDGLEGMVTDISYKAVGATEEGDVIIEASFVLESSEDKVESLLKQASFYLKNNLPMPLSPDENWSITDQLEKAVGEGNSQEEKNIFEDLLKKAKAKELSAEHLKKRMEFLMVSA